MKKQTGKRKFLKSIAPSGGRAMWKGKTKKQRSEWMRNLRLGIENKSTN